MSSALCSWRRGCSRTDQLDEALLEQGCRPDGGSARSSSTRGWSTRRRLAEALAEQHGLEFLDLGEARSTAAAALLPEKFARRYSRATGALPRRQTVLVAVADPTDVVTADDLRLALGLDVKLGCRRAGDLEEAIGRTHRGHVEMLESLPKTTTSDETPIEDVRADGPDECAGDPLVNQVLACGDRRRRLRHPLRAAGAAS